MTWEVNHMAQIFHIRAHQVELPQVLRVSRGIDQLAFHTATGSQQLIGSILDPLRNFRIGGSSVGRIVFETAVGRWIVRRSDHNTIGQCRRAPAIVRENLPRILPASA